jgi:asparagine synthase (glutamine-hydrolysing)
MGSRISHRGPDGQGIWKNQDHGIGLSFCRLSIIDLSDAAMQPMVDAEQSVVLVFNGEIYNHLSVRKELENKGYQYRTSSDTETIIYAYKEWGLACLDKLDGMFAFALYDLRKRQLFLVRDRMGVKPLYFCLHGGRLAFASEIKAFYDLPWFSKTYNNLALYHYLTFMVTPAPYTAYEGVYKLPAGHYALLDAKKNLSFHEWYVPVKRLCDPEKRERAREDFCLKNIHELLNQSVQKRMVADVPVGAFLSGGVDSSLNVALMAQYHRKIKTFTIAFSDDEKHNELAWARRVAKQYGTDHHEMIVSEKEAYDFYKTMVYHLDEPLADCVCIPFYYVAKAAREAGMKVVQVGEGADESFFGYPLYAQYARLHKFLGQPLSSVPKSLLHYGSRFFSAMYKDQPFRKETIDRLATGKFIFWSGAVAFGEVQKKETLGQGHIPIFDPIVEKIYPGMRQEYDSYAIIEYHLKHLKELDPHADFYQQMFYLEFKHRLPELLLMRADKMSMATSIEAREPYLDYHLVEFLYHVPSSLKFFGGQTKYLLKKVAQKYLPDDIIYRKKIGFGAPTAHWMQQGLFFPPYKDAVMQNQPEAIGQLLGNMPWVGEKANKSVAHRAVQNWTIQQLFAFTSQD